MVRRSNLLKKQTNLPKKGGKNEKEEFNSNVGHDDDLELS